MRSVCGERQRDVVQRQDRGLVPVAEAREHGRALDAIERRDRLVADQDRAAVIDGARDRRALLLAAGELAGPREDLVREVDELEHARHLVDHRGGPARRGCAGCVTVERRSRRPI